MMTYENIYKAAYQLMNEPIIEGNCGELCNFHCCRSNTTNKDRLGMYLQPFEFEAIQSKEAFEYEVHSSIKYEMPTKIKKMYYIFCDGAQGCLRELRPIQCRTYPFEPHIENEALYLVIEKEQIHECPLLNQREKWRWAFVEGIYKGWQLLLEIPKVKHYIHELSKDRSENDNILVQYNLCDLEKHFK